MFMIFSGQGWDPQLDLLSETYSSRLGSPVCAYWRSSRSWLIPSVVGILQIGLSYACGILLALSICFATSGGHLSPGVTIAFVIFKRFPKLKAIR